MKTYEAWRTSRIPSCKTKVLDGLVAGHFMSSATAFIPPTHPPMTKSISEDRVRMPEMEIWRTVLELGGMAKHRKFRTKTNRPRRTDLVLVLTRLPDRLEIVVS